MNSKSPGAYLSFLAMVGMFSDPYMDIMLNNPYADLDNPRPKRGRLDNPKQRCFRPDCNRERSGNNLYCSKECFELDKERLKRK